MSLGLERGLFNVYISNNRKRAEPLPFELTQEEFTAITKQNCYICGCEPSQVYWKSKGPFILYNGVDRVDNSKGYVTGNCKACCKKCNSVKSDMGLADLKKHLELMLKGLNSEETKTLPDPESIRNWRPRVSRREPTQG